MSVAAASPSSARPFSSADFGLYGGTVLIWSTTWLALKFQLGVVDPQVSIVWRFLIAGVLMFALCLTTRERVAFPLRMHLRFAALGLFLYSTNFILFYNAGRFVVSGLLAVLFSMASLTNIALAVLLLGEPLRPRVAAGALVGLAGVGLMFLPEVEGHALGSGALVGLLLGILGCLSFSTGNMILARIRADGVPIQSANAWGVSYGVIVNAIVALAAGSPFIIEPTAAYVVGLLWLAIPGSVLAFWLYTALLSRIGPDRAAYTTVLSPVLALLLSTFIEDYRWTPAAIAGLVLVAAGNVLVLRRRRSS